MSLPDTGAEQFKAETEPGNFNSSITCSGLCKVLLLQGLTNYMLFEGEAQRCLRNERKSFATYLLYKLEPRAVMGIGFFKLSRYVLK